MALPVAQVVQLRQSLLQSRLLLQLLSLLQSQLLRQSPL
jgi:hypothetical protein